jgi:hypothetical protein
MQHNRNCQSEWLRVTRPLKARSHALLRPLGFGDVDRLLHSNIKGMRKSVDALPFIINITDTLLPDQ